MLTVSEDAYAGDAQYTVAIDGTQQGGVQTATMSHAAGQSQTLTILGSFGTASHTVTVNFLNDAYGGSASTDRNFYVNGATLNGVAVANSALNEYSAGPQSFAFGSPAPSPVPVPVPTPVPFVPPVASGPAYYVSTGGNDSGDGSAAHPFATLQHAISKTETGTIKTVYMEAGTYSARSAVTLTAADNGVQILAVPGAAVVLDAGGSNPNILLLNGASNVTVSGLTFQNTGLDFLSAALFLSGSNGDSIVGNTFANNGEAVLLAHSSGVTFDHNTVTNSYSSAVEVKDDSNSDVFSNNVINGVGATNVVGAGFFSHGIHNDVFRNNLVENTRGAGIAIEDFGQGYTLNDYNTITQNRVINTSQSQLSTDDGAIYILGRSDTDQHTTVSLNFISNSGNVNSNAHVEGLYLDDNTSGVNLTGNIVQGVQSDAVELHGGYNVHFTGNIFDLGNATRTAALIQQPEPDRPAFIQPGLSNDSFTGNIIVSQQSNPAYTWVYFDPDPVHVNISGNLYWDPNTPGGSLPTVQPVADSAPVTGDPRFSGSYTPGAGSAASLISFTPIDLTKIGPQ